MAPKILAHFLILAGLLFGGCASLPDPALGGLAGNCPDCSGAFGSTGGGGAFGPGDRALLRESRDLFEGTVAEGKPSPKEAQVMRVYRWGRNEDVPLAAYGWNATAGERWHVVRAPSLEGGERESCGRKGGRPIDEFYVADGVTLTVVSVAGDERRLVYGSPVLAN